MSALQAGKTYITVGDHKVKLEENDDPEAPFKTKVYGMVVRYKADGKAVNEYNDRYDIVDMAADQPEESTT